MHTGAKRFFLVTPLRGLLRVTLEESADPNYPPDTFLEINMVNNNEKAPYEKFVRLGDSRDDENPRLMPWYLFVFPSTFPAVSYTKASLEEELKGLNWPATVGKVTKANDDWLNITKANRRNRDVIDLTGEDGNNLLKF